MNWVENYLNKPWELGASGPHSYDCWNLVREATYDRTGVRLPTGAGFALEAVESTRRAFAQALVKHKSNIVALNEPLTYCFVLMGQRDFIHHVGFYVGTGGQYILHIAQNNRSCLQSIPQLKRLGWKLFKFYKYDPNLSNTRPS